MPKFALKSRPWSVFQVSGKLNLLDFHLYTWSSKVCGINHSICPKWKIGTNVNDENCWLYFLVIVEVAFVMLLSNRPSVRVAQILLLWIIMTVISQKLDSFQKHTDLIMALVFLLKSVRNKVQNIEAKYIKFSCNKMEMCYLVRRA